MGIPVRSGFGLILGSRGSSSLVLPDTAADLITAALPAKQTSGARQGLKDRGWVTCRVAGQSFQAAMIVIITDTSSLALPPGVEGLAGLTFLRQFARWGSERTENGWQFFLSEPSES